MSGEIALWAARQDIKNHAAKLTLMALGDAFDDRMGRSTYSFEHAADFARRDEGQIAESLRWLEVQGWIKRHADDSFEIIFTRGGAL